VFGTLQENWTNVSYWLSNSSELNYLRLKLQYAPGITGFLVLCVFSGAWSSSASVGTVRHGWKATCFRSCSWGCSWSRHSNSVSWRASYPAVFAAGRVAVRPPALLLLSLEDGPPFLKEGMPSFVGVLSYVGYLGSETDVFQS
jgi:hypothetical protein